MQAPSTALASVTGKPSAVPNSSPLAPASSGPGNISGVSEAETAMNSSGASGPIESAQLRTSAVGARTSRRRRPHHEQDHRERGGDPERERSEPGESGAPTRRARRRLRHAPAR